jgi:type VI secretion system FHA domain protein
VWALLLSRVNDPPGSYFDLRQLDSGQIKVGRNERSCDLVLPDDKGFVSREHCTIAVSGLDVFVTDTSKNGVCLNQAGARIVPNQPIPVRARDRLLIHDFVITLLPAAEAAGIGLAPPPPPPLPGGPSHQGGDDKWFDAPPDPFWSTGGVSNEVHDFLNNSVIGIPPPPAEPMDAPPSSFGFGDPFGEAFSRPIMAEPLPPPVDFGIPANWADMPQTPLPDPTFGAPPGSAAPFDAAFATPQAPPAAPPPFPYQAQPSAPPPPPFTPPPAAPAASPFAQQPPFAPSVGSPAAPPAAAQPPPQAATPARGAPSATGPDANWDAFFEGAGLTPEELRLPPDAMYRLGVMYRQVVLGLCDILQDRAAFKDEFRVERTQLSIGQNNPLKHLPAIEAARILLGPSLPGFMSTEDAVRTSFEDVKRHQLAMLAGVQQALAVAFDRLSPREVEKLVEKAEAEKKGFLRLSGVDRWGVYVTLFEALRRDATSNANGVMSVAFREGYEKFMKSSR